MMKRDWLERILAPENGIPPGSTIACILASLQPTIFQVCFQSWNSAVKEKKANKSLGTSVAQIAIDGMVLRRSHYRRRGFGPLFLVSVWAVEGGISLGQLAAEDKSNDIPAIPELINGLEIAGCLITNDAAGCQTAIAEQIIDAKGDYVLAQKGNQGKTLQETESCIVALLEKNCAVVVSETEEVTEKNHGRQTTTWYTQFEVTTSMETRHRWKVLRTIGIAVRQCETDRQTSYETRYFLSSLSLDINRFAKAVRKHWKIESSLYLVFRCHVSRGRKPAWRSYSGRQSGVVTKVCDKPFEAS
jgi:predicted transposase YbfD/YdcC